MAQSTSPLSKWKTPLTESEFDELSDFLGSDATSDQTLMIGAVDGYMTAIALEPSSHQSKSWLPGIWGPGEADTPAFESIDQARRMIELLLRHYSIVSRQLENDPAGFTPRFTVHARHAGMTNYVDGDEWAMGFMIGVARYRQNWQPLFDHEQGREWLRPLHLLGSLDITQEEQALIDMPDKRQALIAQIQASVVAIRDYWQPYRDASIERQLAETLQSTAKITRNGRCFCASGRAFEHCCGTAMNLH